jgi:hypothetical protein
LETKDKRIEPEEVIQFKTLFGRVPSARLRAIVTGGTTNYGFFWLHVDLRMRYGAGVPESHTKGYQIFL